MVLIVVGEEGQLVGNFDGCLASKKVSVELAHFGELVGSKHDVCQLGGRNDLVSDIVEIDDHLVARTSFSGN